MGLRLVTRADDAGSFRAANRAIRDAVERGICRNVSVMVPCAYFAEAAELVRGLKGICVGLHATVTAEWDNARWGPVTGAARAPCLVEADGSFKRSARAIQDGGVVYEQVVGEAAAQLARLRGAGVEVSYIDTHMAFTWMHEAGDEAGRVEARLRELAAQEGVMYFGRDWAAGDPGYVLKGRVTPVLKVGAADAGRIARVCAALRSAAAEAPDQRRVMVMHPAEADGEMAAVTHGGREAGSVARERYWDWQSYVDERVVRCVREAGVEAVRVVDV